MTQRLYCVIALVLTFIFSGPIFAQTSPRTTITPRRTTKVIAKKGTAITPGAERQNTVVTATRGVPTGPRKILPLTNKMVWVFGENDRIAHFSEKSANDIMASQIGPYFMYQPLAFNEFNTYDYDSEHSQSKLDTNPFKSKIINREIPKKTFIFTNTNPDWDWVDMKKISTKNIVGTVGKTNLHYFKNIGKNSFISFTSAYDHIIITDTLYAPVSFLSAERDKRNYIKIIANCIVYESPIKPASVSINSKTDYIFSAKEIIFKSKFENLQPAELTPPPPFVIADSNIELHIDNFGKTEQKLLNRLYIEILEQITTELNGLDDAWEKDKLLTEFQNYRYHKVQENVLFADKDPDEAGLFYQQKFNDLCSKFDSRNANKVLIKHRTIGELDVLVEGNIETLHNVPFKYFALPTTATLVPVGNENTGVYDQLGACYFDATGTSNIKITIEVALGYDELQFEQANQLLNKKGMILEQKLPKSLLHFDNQNLKINGDLMGHIIPISGDLLRLEIGLPDQQLSLIKLFPQSNTTTFDLISKIDYGIKEFKQKIVLQVPVDLLQQSDYEHMVNKFNVVESNTMTDHIKVSSQLSPQLDDEGALKYIEISLIFQFDDNQVFRGPFRLSSYSTLASEQEITFIKHSDQYKVKVTGTAFYEDGHRDIKDDFVTDSKFIVLNEDMFKNN